MTLLVLGLILFLGIHSLSIVARANATPWRATWGMALQGHFSVIAIIGLVLIIKGYGAARMDPVVLYTTPAWTSHITALLMLFAFPMFIATYFPGKISSTLKLPMLVAVKTWALGHLLANGMLADVLLFGGFLAWAVADRISLKRRTPRDIPACRRRASMTRSLLCWGWRSMWSSRSGCIRPGLVCPSSAEIVFVDQAAQGSPPGHARLVGATVRVRSNPVPAGFFPAYPDSRAPVRGTARTAHPGAPVELCRSGDGPAVGVWR